jgi:DNA repair exonuclease SbcCD ATPase subunit
MKDYIVDKVDQFLATKGVEFEGAIRREVTNDPTVAEEKVALGKFLEVASHYLTDDDFVYANNQRVEEMERHLSEQKGQIKILEARNMRLNTENQKLNEVARQAQEVLTESTKVERTARKEMAKNAQSKGQKVVVEQVIPEHSAPEPVAKSDDQDSQSQLFQEWRALAAIPNTK